VSPSVKRAVSGLAILFVLVSAVALGRRGIEDPARDAEGRVLVIEYSDYQCPACARAHPVLKGILQGYGDKVRWVHKHYPLELNHPRARSASVAAVCAERQGRFEAYHELLFSRQKDWVESKDPGARFKTYAREAGLDARAFEACLPDPEADGRVSADIREGDRLRVQSTPTFFVHGERLAGGRQLQEKGALLIERALRK